MMRSLLGRFLVIGFMLGALVNSVAAETAEVGKPAPEFCLPASSGGKVCLKDFKGKDNVVLLFYLLDFTSG
jgi:hypothetical protein